MKGGIDWNLRSWTIPTGHLSDVPLSRNWHKTVSKFYQNVFICKIWVRIIWSELPPMAVQYIGHVIQTETCDDTIILHCHWRNFWTRDTDVYLTYIRFGIHWHSFIPISRDRNIRWMSYRSRSTPEIHFSFTVTLSMSLVFAHQ